MNKLLRLWLAGLCWFGLQPGPSLLAAQFDRDHAEGLLLLQQGLFEAALPALQRSCQRQPRAENCFALGVALFRLYHFGEAHQAYQSALQNLPDPELKARIRSGMGDLYFETEDYALAVRAYREALEHEPQWQGARMRLATAYLRLQRYSEALQETERMLAQQSSQAEIHYLRGLIHLAGQNWTQATAELEALSQYPRHRLEAWQHLNWMHRFRQDYVAATQLADQMVESYGTQAPQTYQVAALTRLEHLSACRPQGCQVTPLIARARQDLERWVLLMPEQPQAYFYLGQVAQAQYDWDSARQAYQRAQKLFPERLEYRLKLAEMHLALGQKTQAQALLMALPTGVSYSETVWLELGKWQERFPELLNHWLSTARPTQPLNQGRQRFWQGYVAWRQGLNSSQKTWSEATELLANQPEARLIEALQLWQAGEKRWSLNLLQQVFQVHSDWWLPTYQLGLFHAASDCNTARPWLQSAYTQHPGSLVLNETLLSCLETLPEYKAQLQRALQTFPEHKAFQARYLTLLANETATPLNAPGP